MIRDIALPVALLSLLQVGMCAPDEVSPPPEEVALEVLPEEMRGRWGLTDADCARGAAESKGLMVVTARHLTFYDSRATLREVEHLGPETVNAEFAFTGAGTTWSQDVSLTLGDDQDTLRRQEVGPDAESVDLIYRRCDGD